jgi:hypothetical protein
MALDGYFLTCYDHYGSLNDKFDKIYYIQYNI